MAGTEADAVAKLTREGSAGQPGWYTEDATVGGVAVPEGWEFQIVDLERHQVAPRRPVGSVQVHDADGFGEAVLQRRNGELTSALYADEENMALVAVLNDDGTVAAGWRDHRVQLQLRRTAEWQHWKQLDRQMVGQERFASHVEDGLPEIAEPDPATMLELAQTFHATTSARFRGGNRLASGARQLVYEEDVDASAGANGNVVIPDVIKLNVRPFLGSERYEVTARFRFRLKGPELSLGYVLDRPDDVERAAFRTVRDRVIELTDLSAIAGVAPGARVPTGTP